MPHQDPRIEELEARIDKLETEVDDARAYAEAVKRQMQALKTGLLELQVNELQTGTMLSTDGVDDYRLENEIGLDLTYVGDEHQYLRLTDPDDVGDEKALSASLPDAGSMCQLEQLRQVYRRGIMDLDELGDAETQRAVLVWDNIDTLAEEAGTNQKNWRVDSEKVRRIIKKHHDVKEGSLYELSRRVMQLIPDLTDGVLSLEKNGGVYLVGEKESIQAELKPLYESTELDDGSNIVVRR